MAFWPLVLLALLTRLSFGSLAQPSAVFDDPVRQLTKLAILCDEPSPFPGQDSHHPHADDGQDGLFPLGEAQEFLPLVVTAVLFASLFLVHIQPGWRFPPVRGPPFTERSSLCPQGPPV